MQNKVFIIEHLESELYPWCIIEYKHISKITGKNNLWFTNIQEKDMKKLTRYGKVFTKSVKDLDLSKACILDPEAPETLNTTTANDYAFFIFGGILGDYPPKKRTKEEVTRFMKIRSFNIGKEQMSTDNAVYAVRQIIEGKSLIELKFKDGLDIKINRIQSTQLPYRYNVVNGKPLVSRELVKFIKKIDKI